MIINCSTYAICIDDEDIDEAIFLFREASRGANAEAEAAKKNAMADVVNFILIYLLFD